MSCITCCFKSNRVADRPTTPPAGAAEQRQSDAQMQPQPLFHAEKKSEEIQIKRLDPSPENLLNQTKKTLREQGFKFTSFWSYNLYRFEPNAKPYMCAGVEVTQGELIGMGEEGKHLEIFYTGPMTSKFSPHGRGRCFIKVSSDYKANHANCHDFHIYTGDYVNGESTGQCTYSFANNKMYEGGIKNGRYHGKGKLMLSNGEVYIGQFRHGKKHGTGYHIDTTKSLYQGEFKKGLKHGRGSWMSSTGRVIDGMFHKDAVVEIFDEESSGSKS